MAGEEARALLEPLAFPSLSASAAPPLADADFFFPGEAAAGTAAGASEGGGAAEEEGQAAEEARESAEKAREEAGRAEKAREKAEAASEAEAEAEAEERVRARAIAVLTRAVESGARGECPRWKRCMCQLLLYAHLGIATARDGTAGRLWGRGGEERRREEEERKGREREGKGGWKRKRERRKGMWAER